MSTARSRTQALALSLHWSAEARGHLEDIARPWSVYKLVPIALRAKPFWFRWFRGGLPLLCSGPATPWAPPVSRPAPTQESEAGGCQPLGRQGHREPGPQRVLLQVTKPVREASLFVPLKECCFR